MKQETLDKLKIYQGLLDKWQSKINLISSKTLDEAWDRHFEDSMQVIDYIPDSAKIIFDLGSGGGFPGLVVAISRPDITMHLVESDQKKCSFLKTVSRETDCSAHVHNERIESVSCETAPDVIMARALASLPDLFDYCHKWVEQNPDLVFIFPKGARAQEELLTLSKNWQYDYQSHASKTDEEASILVFSNIQRL